MISVINVVIIFVDYCFKCIFLNFNKVGLVNEILLIYNFIKKLLFVIF